jgi:aryl-alcohol dehydrogenase-like predicted oxidoreductase
MRYTTFGRTSGLRVSEYALGAGNFGTRWGTKAEPAEARRMFDRFAEAGGTFIDTANSYQFGQSEELLGEFLGADRDRFVLATKFAGSTAPQPTVNTTGNGRRNMIATVEASLRRLRADHIDLLWVHHSDTVTPMEEILRGLDDLTRAGKIHHAGLSNFPAWRVSRGVTIADLRGWSPITAVQFEYSLVERTGELDLLPMAEALGLGVALWSPLGGGLLTGKYRSSDEGRLTDWQARLVHTESTAQKTAVVDAVLDIATETGASPAEVAVAWLRERSARSTTPLVPITGPRDVGQLDSYLAALDVQLSAAQYDRLAEVSAAPLGVPHAVSESTRSGLLGGDASVFLPPSVPVG